MAALFIPFIIIGLTFVVISAFVLLARRWKKCEPDEVLIVFGRKKTEEIADPDQPGQTKRVQRGYRLISRGGATFVVPVFEGVSKLPLNTFPVPFSVEDTPNVDGVLVTVDALANMKISSDPELLGNAVERLLGKSPEQIEKISTDTLSGILRQIVGTLTVEQIIKDRESIQQQVLVVGVTELGKLGLHVDNFVIQRISDKGGYIDALGKKRTAEVKRDADIAMAEATKEADIKSAAARQAGEVAKAEAARAISDADRVKDMAIADNETQVKRRQARIVIEAETAGQEARQDLERQRVAAERVKAEEETSLQEILKRRREAELEATTVTEARKQAEALVIVAQGKQEAAEKDGEALRIRRSKEGEGEREYSTAAAEGRKAAASALQAEKEAEAAGNQAQLIAHAEGTKAQGEADGTAKQALLVAEAKGLEAKNKALAELSDGARLIMILEQLPKIIEEAGEAGERIVGSAFEHVGAGLSRIDSVRIVDMGGNGNGAGNSAAAKFALTAPEIVFGTLARMEELGIDVEGLLKMVGVDVSKLKMLTGSATASELESEEHTA